MTIRTWVAWNKNRTLTYALPLFSIFCWVGGFAAVGIHLQSLRCQSSVLIFWSLVTYRIFYAILRSRSQSPHLLCWVLLDAKRSHCICLLGSPSPLWHRCGCDLSQDAVRNVLKFKLCISDVDIDDHSSLESLWACSYVDLTSRSFLRDNSDRSQGRSPLMEVVHRDGQSHLLLLLFIF